MTEVPGNDTENSSGDIAYAYKAALFGVPLEFRLTESGLEWSRGGVTGLTPYNRIRRIRLGFRPMTMQNHRFLTEIWPAEGRKLQIASTSWKGMVEHERFDADYRAFVIELCRRVGAAGGTPLLQTGSPAFVYWPGVAVFAGVWLALAWLVVRALQHEAWGGAAFIVAFLAFFLWQGGGFFRRNRPGTFEPDAVPPQVLPKG